MALTLVPSSAGRAQPADIRTVTIRGVVDDAYRSQTSSEDTLRQTVQADPKLASAYGDLGFVYSFRGEPDKAMSALRRAKQLDFRLVPAQTELGFVLMRLGKDDEALWEFREALRVDSRSIAEFREAIKLEPKYGDAYFALARASYETGQYVEAWDAVDQARTLGVEVPPAFVDALSARMPRPSR